MSKITPLPNRTNLRNYQPDVEVPEDIRLSLFNQNSPDIGFFNEIDQEVIELGGSDFYYIKYMDSENFDKTFEEDTNKVYGNKIIVRGHYPPIAIAQEMSKFGVSITNDQQFTFNKDYLIKKLGREPHPGDIIQPRFQDLFFEVKEVQDSAYQIYGVYHLVLSAQIKKDISEVMAELRVS